MTQTESRAWLIERVIEHEVLYWTGRRTDQFAFRPAVEFACRFARKSDAARVLYHLLNNVGRVTEHIWVEQRETAQVPQ